MQTNDLAQKSDQSVEQKKAEKFDHNTKETLKQRYSERDQAIQLLHQIAVGVEEGLMTIRFYATEYVKIKDQIEEVFKGTPEGERIKTLRRTIDALIIKIQKRLHRYTDKVCTIFLRTKGKKKLEGKMMDRFLDYASRYMGLSELVYVELYNAIRESIDLLAPKFPNMLELVDKYDIANYDGKMIQDTINENVAKQAELNAKQKELLDSVAKGE